MPQPSVRSHSVGAQGGASSGTLTVNKPAGVVAGDILIARASDSGGTLANLGTPTGGDTWQLLTSRDDTGLKSKLFWKVAGSSEPSSYAFSFRTFGFGLVTIVAVQDGSSSTPTVASVATGSGTTVNTPGITPPDAASLEIRFAVAGTPEDTSGAWTHPAGYTEIGEQSSEAETGSDTAHKQLTSGTATGTLAFTTANTLTTRHGFTVAIATGSIPATITPTVVDALANISTPALRAGQTIHPASVDAAADIPVPGISAGARISPVSVDAQAVIPTPSVTAGSAELIEPTTVTATADIPTPAITAISNATLGPATVDAVADIPTPAITAIRQSVVSPVSVDAQAVIPTPGLTVPILPGELITADGQVEWGGVLWGAGTSYRVREITGWVDQKPQLDDLSVEEAFRHGALAGTSYAQRRIVTIALQVDSIFDPTQVSGLLRQLRYDTRTLRDNTLWTVVIRGYTEMLLAHGKVTDRTGVMDGSYSIGAPEPVITIMCPDPRCYSLEQQSTVIGPMGTETLINDGDCYTSPIIRFTGPCVNPTVLNETLDRILAFDITLTSGQRLDVDTQRGSVLLGGANTMGKLAGSISVPPKEFFLDTGASVITYETDSGGAAGVEFIWRSAYL
ncbi:hypothetical protein [Streptosporangium roseum]|uniref:hypothetical protein n=1 Tax=Streptosporangium roseum TaxID=2001 RepID=UPI0033206948